MTQLSHHLVRGGCHRCDKLCDPGRDLFTCGGHRPDNWVRRSNSEDSLLLCCQSEIEIVRHFIGILELESLSDGGIQSAGNSGPRQCQPRASLQPNRNPELVTEFGNRRIYAVAYQLWTTDIAKNGPAHEALVGTAIFGVPYRLFEIYHVFPASDKQFSQSVKQWVGAIGDVFEVGQRTILVSPGLLVALEPKSGEMIWSGITGKLSQMQYEEYVRGPLSSYIGVKAGSVGWEGY
jgi:hypothetical protein